MAKNSIQNSDPFDEHSRRYDNWFDKHQKIYESELKAVREAAPSNGKGLEVGVGSGRFSGPLSIDFGLDPSRNLLDMAEKRGTEVVRGVGEKMPFREATFNFVLIVTTICFFDDPLKALQETARILETKGEVIVGFIDKESRVGKIYQKKKDENVFYGDADFFTVEEVNDLLKKVGFSDLSFLQTIFGDLNKMEVDKPRKGYGEGSFVVVEGSK